MISAAPIIWTPAVEGVDEQPTEPSAPIPEQTMPDHLIFDYFTPADDTETEQTMPDQRAEGYPPVPVGAGGPPPTLPPWAQASGSVPNVSARPRPGRLLRPPRRTAPRPPPIPIRRASSPPQRPGPPGQYPPGQYPPGQYPPGQYPPGQRRVSREGAGGAAPPGYRPGPPTQPYGARAARVVRAATRPVRAAQGRDRSVPGVG